MMMDIFVGVNLPALLIIGFVIATIMLILGFVEKKNPPRKKKLMAAGTILMGIMVVAVPLTWYGYWAITMGSILMTIADILIIAFLSILGGIIITLGIVSNRT
jgi:hypothetical protein